MPTVFRRPQVPVLAVVAALLISVATPFAQNPVYVDFEYPGTEVGTAQQPFDTIGEAVTAVATGGTVIVDTNNSHEAITISKALTLTTQGGVVRVGVLSSLLGSGAPLKWLRITEIMYKPGDGGAEYLELQNTGPASLNISGVQFTEGIVHTFPGSTVLSPGQYIVLVRSTDASLFSTNYPSTPIGGFYTGALDNAGETIELSTPTAIPFLSVTYNDAGGWPGTADGLGHSLIIINPQGNPNDPNNWRGSTENGGSPGGAESDPDNPLVVVNEALTHTDLPQTDTVELYNPTGQPADVRGWFITDNKDVPQKARIPSTAEFIIPAGGYVTLDESDFAPPPDGSPGSVGGNALPGFRLSAFGEGIYILSATPAGALTGYMHGFAFGAAENGVSFGRTLTSDSREHFVAQTASSFGGANPGPAMGPVVVSEIHYNPVPAGVEYVEIRNRSGSTVNLYDDSGGGNPSNTFRISGIDFEFPPNVSLAAGGRALIVNAPPAHYQAEFAPSGVQVFGPFGNYDDANAYALNNGSETVRVLWPDQEGFDPDVGANVVPYVAMDTVRYDDDPPWPNADNNFNAIRRNVLGNFGGEPSNWAPQATSHQPAGGVVAPVTLSLARGFYATNQSLTMTSPTAGSTIYFTQDGSLPAPGFGTTQQYTGAIAVTSNRAIRAAAYKAGMIRSPDTAATYIIGAPAHQRGIDSLAIIADPQEDLFTPRGVMAIQGGTYVSSTFSTLQWVPNLPNTSQSPLDDPFQPGIQTWLNALGNPVYPSGGAPDPTAYNNAIRSGRVVERPASFEYLDRNSPAAGLQVDAGVRVHGSTFHRPRYAMNPAGDWTTPLQSSIPDIILSSYLKFSLRMYFRGDYGPPKLTWDIFPGDTLLSYDKVVLRGGHNDGYNPFLKDELTRRLYRDMGRVTARGALYNLFINGVYRGYYNATERHDSDFLSTRFGASKDWDVLTHPLDVAFDPFNPQVSEGDRASWDALMAAAGENLAITANYNAVAALLDINAFIDYLLVQLYSGNDDWPNNNYAVAHERVPGGKWYFLVWDAEATYLSANLNKTGLNFFPFWQWAPSGGAGLKGESVPIAALYRALVVNATFRTAFQARAQLHFGPGGALSAANVSDRYTALRAEIQAALPPSVTYNDFIGTTWIPNRQSVVISDLQAEGLYP